MAKNKIDESKEATVRGNGMPVSMKQCMAICDFIKGKKIEAATKELEEVIKMKRAIPMKGEVPHRKGGFGGRYPIKASKIFINMLKSLSANASAKGIDAENAKIFAKADKASRPRRAGKYGGRKFKRTHIFISVK